MISNPINPFLTFKKPMQVKKTFSVAAIDIHTRMPVCMFTEEGAAVPVQAEEWMRPSFGLIHSNVIINSVVAKASEWKRNAVNAQQLCLIVFESAHILKVLQTDMDLYSDDSELEEVVIIDVEGEVTKDVEKQPVEQYEVPAGDAGSSSRVGEAEQKQ